MGQLQILRSRDWIEKCCVLTLTTCMKPLHKWSKGTGGGPGTPENFYDGKERDDKLFINYDDTSRTCLTWIHMKDKETGFFLLKMMRCLIMPENKLGIKAKILF